MKVAELEGCEFVVISAVGERLILQNESGELFVVESMPDEMGQGGSYLLYYQMQAKEMTA